MAPKAGGARSDMGLTMHAWGLSGGPWIRAVPARSVVVGGDGVFAAGCDRSLAEWVAAAADTADRVASVCGAFILAEAGLLDGRRVTTHWREADRLARETRRHR